MTGQRRTELRTALIELQVTFKSAIDEWPVRNRREERAREAHEKHFMDALAWVRRMLDEEACD